MKHKSLPICNFHCKNNITILTCEYHIAQLSCCHKENTPNVTSGNQISCRNYRFEISTSHTSHSPNQLPAINDLAGKYTQIGTIPSPSGVEGRKYIIFTGKYGIINFKMKNTYYPTLLCEYHIARFPTLRRMEGSVWKKNSIRWISQVDIGRHSHLQSQVMQAGRATGLNTIVSQEKTHVNDEPLIPARTCRFKIRLSCKHHSSPNSDSGTVQEC